MELAACRFVAIRAPFSPRAGQTIKSSFPGIDLSQPISQPTRFFSTDHPPWLRPKLPPVIILPPDIHLPLLPSGPGTIRAYTDGSVIGGCTGYGLFVCNSEGIVATCRGKLPSHCSIFQAEGFALLQALRFASTMSPQPGQIEIFSDSRAALTASLSTTKICHPFMEIRTLLLGLPFMAQLFWIASHCGHQGNELADILAKQGALGPGAQTDSLPTPIASLRLGLNRATMELWSGKWSSLQKASITKSFFPSIESAAVIAKLDLPSHVNQILSGHSRLRAFLFKTKCIESPVCKCGSDDETVPHFLFHCSLQDQYRDNFKATSLRVCKMWPPRPGDIARFKPLLSSFISFISKTKHFQNHFPSS